MRSPTGNCPGIEPGQMALGQSSACAGAPSSTGGIFNIDSSSVGNLKPASLKALPKSLSLGKSMWQVLQEVLYCRENAGMASARGGVTSTAMTTARMAMTPKKTFLQCLDISHSSYEVLGPAFSSRIRSSFHGNVGETTRPGNRGD